MDSFETRSSLVGLIYDAALDPDRWPDVLRSIAASVGAAGAALVHHDMRDHRGGILAAVGADPEAVRKYDEHFAAHDPWLKGGEVQGLLDTGTVRLGDELVARRELVRTEYYNDFAKPYAITRICGGVIGRNGAATSTLTTLRPESREPFGEDERRLLQALFPHLRRALQVHRRLVGVERLKQSAMDALNRLPMGVIFARQDASVVFANRAAQEILDERDGLIDASMGLAGATSFESDSLRTLVHQAARTNAGQGTRSGGALSMSRPSRRRPLAVLVTPLRMQTQVDFAEHQEVAMVFVSDPERAVEASAETLRRIWGLTPTEAAIAAGLAAGHAPSTIADDLSIAAGTVRWHIKSVLAKTGTHRQGDLVRLLTTGPAIVSD
jgi:DNA-binding CsgD family transcriptional regulator/PAS domain-containing protein